MRECSITPFSVWPRTQVGADGPWSKAHPPFTVHVPCSFYARSLAVIHAGDAHDAPNLINPGVRAADASSMTSVLFVTTKHVGL
jgi:hypothetical protein